MPFLVKYYVAVTERSYIDYLLLYTIYFQSIAAKTIKLISSPIFYSLAAGSISGHHLMMMWLKEFQRFPLSGDFVWAKKPITKVTHTLCRRMLAIERTSCSLPFGLPSGAVRV